MRAATVVASAALAAAVSLVGPGADAGGRWAPAATATIHPGTMMYT